MNDVLPVKGILEDWAFIALAAVSLVFVLVALLRGGWRYITRTIIYVVVMSLSVAWLGAILVAVLQFAQAAFGPHGRRGVTLTWGVIATAFALVIPHVIGYLYTDKTAVGRFLRKCVPEGWGMPGEDW